ncbi:hypothetical protein C8J57DRAFT_1464124 [Mycena rebaudengoi]|nr:hypothetical protein C8J57DRAFT_1464124 [Mycena rebaudengoi]
MTRAAFRRLLPRNPTTICSAVSTPHRPPPPPPLPPAAAAAARPAPHYYIEMLRGRYSWLRPIAYTSVCQGRGLLAPPEGADRVLKRPAINYMVMQSWKELCMPLTSAVRAPPHDLGMLPSMHIDILYKVLRHLHPIDLIHLSRTSTDFRALLPAPAPCRATPSAPRVSAAHLRAPLGAPHLRCDPLRLTIPLRLLPQPLRCLHAPPRTPTTAPPVPVISPSASSASIAHTPTAPPPPLSVLNG